MSLRAAVGQAVRPEIFRGNPGAVSGSATRLYHLDGSPEPPEVGPEHVDATTIAGFELARARLAITRLELLFDGPRLMTLEGACVSRQEGISKWRLLSFGFCETTNAECRM